MFFTGLRKMLLLKMNNNIKQHFPEDYSTPAKLKNKYGRQNNIKSMPGNLSLKKESNLTKKLKKGIKLTIFMLLVLL